MDAIRKEYTLLFNAITDAESALEQLRTRLIAVQQEAEELFLASEEQSAENCCICSRHSS